MLPRAKDLRKGRLSSSGYTYSVNATTYKRIPTFSNFSSARKLVLSIKHSDDAYLTETIGFVVMPDHFHWLFTLGNQETLSNVMKVVKGRSAQLINRQQGSSGGIWQKGFYDRCIRRESDLRSITRYIIANPLRAGLVNNIKQYPHWDCIYI
jgi:REP element-mobilizing transposase RayT